jgi:DNA-binding transcriptional LysR family regulator
MTAPLGLGGMVTSAIASYHAVTPHVSLEIDLTERRVDLLAEGFDIAVRTGTIDSADLVARKISETTRQLFASRSYLDRSGRPKRIADLSSHDLIATHTSASGAVWDLASTEDGSRTAAQRRQRFAFAPRLVVNEVIAAKSAALAGIGIVLLPSGLVESSELERVLPNVSGEAGGVWVVYPARRSLTAAVRSCVEHLVATLPTTVPHARGAKGGPRPKTSPSPR